MTVDMMASSRAFDLMVLLFVDNEHSFLEQWWAPYAVIMIARSTCLVLHSVSDPKTLTQRQLLSRSVRNREDYWIVSLEGVTIRAHFGHKLDEKGLVVGLAKAQPQIFLHGGVS